MSAEPPRAEAPLVVQWELHRDWRFVNYVRRSVMFFVSEVCGREADVAERIGLAAHELFENATKYGTGETASVRVEASMVDGAVRVQVRNAATPEAMQTVRSIFEAMARAEDVQSHYIELLNHHMHARPIHGLGLARIKAEAELELSCATGDGVLTIEASARGGR